MMLEVTLSEQYQVAIPKEIRDSLHLKAGQIFTVVLKGDLIALVPKPSIKAFRGILKGANTDNVRDRSERI
jgi:AbrB family looped-hinge helix DNA binding protein